MVNILFAALKERWAEYEAPLRAAFDAQGLDVTLSCELQADQVDYIIYAPNSDLQDFTPFTQCKAVLSLWAGVEDIVTNETLTQPLARMVDPDGLTQGMVEWVSGHVLRHHLGMDAHIHGLNGQWTRDIPPLASERSVLILGLGALGLACGRALAQLGFNVSGWSRSEKKINGITTFHGKQGLNKALEATEVVVLLLPLTAETENILDAETLAQLPKGAIIINPGRGPLIDDDALIAALDVDHIAHATLDVFREEPLPPDHAFWSHPKVTVTPHLASETRAATAALVLAENLAGNEVGKGLSHLVDRGAGY